MSHWAEEETTHGAGYISKQGLNDSYSVPQCHTAAGNELAQYCHNNINNIIVLSGVKLSPFVPPTHNAYNNIYTHHTAAAHSAHWT